jgi:hypothetical protein
MIIENSGQTNRHAQAGKNPAADIEETLNMTLLA